MNTNSTLQRLQDIVFTWYTFEQLAKEDVYSLLQLRQQVFIVEQNCPYLDADGLDQHAYHLLAHLKHTPSELAGYLRVIPPGRKFTEPAIGRLLTTQTIRGTGLGRELMAQAIGFIKTQHPGLPIKISAQLYLSELYIDLGFQAISEPYDEDGIPHIMMLHPK